MGVDMCESWNLWLVACSIVCPQYASVAGDREKLTRKCKEVVLYGAESYFGLEIF